MSAFMLLNPANANLAIQAKSAGIPMSTYEADYRRRFGFNDVTKPLPPEHQAAMQRGAENEAKHNKTEVLAGGLALGGTLAAGLSGIGAGTAASAGGTAAGAATSAEGVALGSGLTPGVAGAAGLTPGAAGASGVAAAAPVGTSLAPGYFAAETLAPVAAGSGAAFGGSSGASGGGSAITPSGTGTGVSGGTLANLALGIPGALGAVASSQQADAYKDLARDYMAVGAPARARFEASYAPGFSMEDDPGYKEALEQAAKATLHGLSVGGNPAGSPNAWAQSLTDLYKNQSYRALQDYRNQNASAGGMGALTAAAPSASGSAISAQGNVFNSIGAAANDIFNPPKTLTQILREIRAAGF
jgi:hypothetical protein